MKDSERKSLLAGMEKFRKEIGHNKTKSKNFLKKAGIITEKGNLKTPYKHLCIPQEQA